MATMKTPVTLLQELMIKLQETPEYACVGQTGPPHCALFEYECRARGVAARAIARSKKDAKQEAARRVLAALTAGAGPEGGRADAEADREEPSTVSYVALLRELCEQYRLSGPEWRLVSDTGPPHLRRFEVAAAVGAHSRCGAATTKKAARQLAARQLYTYLRENLAHVTRDFEEGEALVRAHEKASARYKEVKEEPAWRPDLSLRVADYHLGLAEHIGATAGRRERALGALADAGLRDGAEAAAFAALGLAPLWEALAATRPDESVQVWEVPQTTPALAFAGAARGEAAARAGARRAAHEYLRASLARQPRAPPELEGQTDRNHLNADKSPQV